VETCAIGSVLYIIMLLIQMLTREQERNLTTKQAIEYFCFKYFTEWQQKEYQTTFDFIRFGEPPEPDMFAELNGREVGIETATLYGGRFDAARLLGRINDEYIQDDVDEEALIPLDRVYHRLSSIIKYKQNKEYSTGKPWLLIQNAFRLFFKDDFQCVERRYNRGQFEQIWLVCDAGGHSGILRLDNNGQ